MGGGGGRGGGRGGWRLGCRILRWWRWWIGRVGRLRRGLCQLKVGVCGKGWEKRAPTSLLGYRDFFFDGQFGHFHAEGLAQFLLRFVEDVLELPSTVRCEHWSQISASGGVTWYRIAYVAVFTFGGDVRPSDGLSRILAG